MRALFDKLYKGSEADFNQLIERHLIEKIKTFVITANPEVFMKMSEIVQLKEMADRDSTIITPDGEGVVLAARRLGYDLWGKIAGVDTVAYLLKMGDRMKLSLYIYGSSQEVLDALQKIIDAEYPNLRVYGMKNGYTSDECEVMADMIRKAADINLFALGVPRQECLIAQYFDQFDHGIFIGCGGSLDVLSGTKKRAPNIVIKCKMEWAYRLLKEPKRIKRFYDSNVKFLYEIQKLKKVKRQ